MANTKFDLYPWGTPKCCKSQGTQDFKLRLQATQYVKLLWNRQGCWNSSTKPTIVPKAADLPACRCSYKWGWQATVYSKISTPIDFRSKLSHLEEKVIWKRRSCCSILLVFGKCNYPASKNNHLGIIYADFKVDFSNDIPYSILFCHVTRS